MPYREYTLEYMVPESDERKVLSMTVVADCMECVDENEYEFRRNGKVVSKLFAKLVSWKVVNHKGTAS